MLNRRWIVVSSRPRAKFHWINCNCTFRLLRTLYWVLMAASPLSRLYGRSQNVLKHDFGNFRSAEQQYDGCVWLARYDFLLVFYSDFGSRWNRVKLYVCTYGAIEHMLYENVTSSTKPEVRNVWQRHQKPEDRACTLKFGRMITDFIGEERQAVKQIYRDTTGWTLYRMTHKIVLKCTWWYPINSHQQVHDECDSIFLVPAVDTVRQRPLCSLLMF